VPLIALLIVEQGREVQQKIGAFKYLECSARTNEGVSEVFEFATRGALFAKSNAKSKKQRSIRQLFSRFSS
jgi:Ras family protein A